MSDSFEICLRTTVEKVTNFLKMLVSNLIQVFIVSFRSNYLTITKANLSQAAFAFQAASIKSTSLLDQILPLT